MENFEHSNRVAAEPQGTSVALTDWQVDEAVVVEIHRQPAFENPKTEIRLAEKKVGRFTNPFYELQ
jgi:hypothetical protein